MGLGFYVVQSPDRPPSPGLVVKMMGCQRETPGPFREKLDVKPTTNLVAGK